MSTLRRIQAKGGNNSNELGYSTTENQKMARVEYERNKLFGAEKSPESGSERFERVSNGKRSNDNAKSQALLIVLIVVAVLYFARTIFIPLAFSVLLTFMLAPLVSRLRRWGLGRVPAAAIVVFIAFSILVVFGGIMASQLGDLAQKFPEYQHNLHQKLESIRSSGGGLMKRMTGTVQEFTEEITPPSPQSNTPPSEERPVPVEIRRAPFSPIESVQKVLGSVFSLMVTMGIVVVFVIFMLIQREDLRDRLVRLAGSRQINLTTNVLDDAAYRVSRYLLAQFVINSSYGLVTGTVLYFIHIPNPLLWGMLAAVLRYIPYLGIWVAALMPAAVALAVKPGWVEVPTVLGVYLGVDLLMYNFIEPLLYGSSTGLSPLAVLVAAVFWTWLWGPAGLLLAMPLTVCVVVIGHHVPNLTFLQVLLSDEPVLPPETRFYQRMLALDLEDALLVCEDFLKGKSLEDLYDAVIVPALSLAEEDRHRGKLDEAKEQFLFQNTRSLIEDIAERAEELIAGTKNGNGGKVNESEKIILESAAPTEVLCIPARDEADELAAFMLQMLLQKRGITGKTIASAISPSALAHEFNGSKPKVACVTAIPPFAYMHTRYLCRRLRNQLHELRLVAALLTEKEAEQPKTTSGPPSADDTAPSLKQAVNKIVALYQPHQSNPSPAMIAS
jgi:predicted PurR-regulated permease PerM